MFSKANKKLWGYLFLTGLWLSIFQASWPSSSLASPSVQSGCVDQVIGDAEIIASEAVDIDRDGELDRVVLYINDNASRRDDPIYVLVVLNQSLAHCEVVLNEYLIWSALTTGRQTINVREIEMIELTGDNSPELYIWLEKGGGGAHESIAFHTIYTLVDGSWKHALGNVGITQCLAFSSFEFIDAPSGGAKDIYLDEDRLCNPPWSSHRTYSILRWNGSNFVSIESGTVNISTTDPPWVNICCVATMVGPVVVLILTTHLRKKGRPNTTPSTAAPPPPTPPASGSSTGTTRSATAPR